MPLARARGFAAWTVKKYGKRDALRRATLRRDSPESKSEKVFWGKVVKIIKGYL